MKLWVDDVRPAPEGYVWCHSVNAAKTCIEFFEHALELAQYEFEHGPEMRNPITISPKFHEQRVKDWSIELIDLDYDSGDYEKDGGPYIKLMDWLVERGTLYPLAFHSQNCVGMEYMKRMYRRYWLGESL